MHSNTHKEGEREHAQMCLLITQMPAAASGHWEPGTQFTFPTWMAGTQVLEASPAAT